MRGSDSVTLTKGAGLMESGRAEARRTLWFADEKIVNEGRNARLRRLRGELEEGIGLVMLAK